MAEHNSRSQTLTRGDLYSLVSLIPSRNKLVITFLRSWTRYKNLIYHYTAAINCDIFKYQPIKALGLPFLAKPFYSRVSPQLEPGHSAPLQPRSLITATTSAGYRAQVPRPSLCHRVKRAEWQFIMDRMVGCSKTEAGTIICPQLKRRQIVGQKESWVGWLVVSRATREKIGHWLELEIISPGIFTSNDWNWLDSRQGGLGKYNKIKMLSWIDFKLK